MKCFRIYKKIKVCAFRGSRLFLSLLVLASCIPDPLELKEIPVVQPEIVVATQMAGDSSVVVLLTRTFSALEGSKDMDPEEFFKKIVVNDALVTISGPGGTDTLSFRENGIYGGLGTPLLEGRTYELHVKSETLGTVSSTARVQAQVKMKLVEADLYYEGLDDTLAVVDYRFQDPSEENHYLLNVQKVEGENLLGNAINPETYTMLFDDSDFNGESYEENFTFFPADFATGDTIAVSLANISREYYQFMELRAEKRLNFLEFLSEPANYPSNIKGGKGFFSLYVPDVRLLVLAPEE
jgi:hypothetical protein